MPNIIRIRDLSTETDLTNAYVPIDKSSYVGTAKKILMSDIANYVGVVCGVTFDIFTGELTIETNYGYYLTDLDGRYAVYLEDLQDVSGTTSPSENDVLVYKSSFWTSVGNFISGLTFDVGTGVLTLMTQIGNFSYDLDGRYATELNELLDVNAPTPSENDVLVYSGGIWINSAATFGAAAVSYLTGLTDVYVTNLQSSDFLMFSGNSWINVSGISSLGGGAVGSNYQIQYYDSGQTNNQGASDRLNWIDMNTFYIDSQLRITTGITNNEGELKYDYINHKFMVNTGGTSNTWGDISILPVTYDDLAEDLVVTVINSGSTHTELPTAKSVLDSFATTVGSASPVNSIWVGTQTEYDALTPVATTLYFII